MGNLIAWKAKIRQWRYPILGTALLMAILSIYLNATYSTSTVQLVIPDRRCKVVIPGVYFPVNDSKAFCDSLAMALLFNTRDEFHRLFKRYYTYSTATHTANFLNDSVSLKVTYDGAAVAERGPSVYYNATLAPWIQSDHCTAFRFFNTQFYCFNQINDQKSGKNIKRNGLDYMIPVMTTLKYTHVQIGSRLVQDLTGEVTVDSYDYTNANNTIYTDASNFMALGYKPNGIASENRDGVNFKYGDPTGCNPYLDANFTGAANHKSMPVNLWPNIFTPGANGRHEVIFVCGHTINGGSERGHAEVYKKNLIGRISDAAIMYHEAVHVFGGHTGCDNNIYNTSHGKDRDYVSVYGTHINLNFQLSISPYLSCGERKYIFNVARRELHGTETIGAHDAVNGKLCSGQELNARGPNGALIIPSHYLENSPPVCN